MRGLPRRQLWLLAQHTGDLLVAATGRGLQHASRARKDDRDVHDLGFLFLADLPALVRADRRPDARTTSSSTAGRTLALRFNEKGRYLRSFVAPDSLFIDIMMNVGIIFYAASETGDPDLARIAPSSTAGPRARTLVRGDGGTAHEGIFDLETGEFLRQTTQQGWRADSLLGARPGLVALRLRHRLPLHRRPAVPRHGHRLRRLLPRTHRRPSRPAQ